VLCLDSPLSSKFLSQNSRLKLPSLDKEGKPRPQTAAGVVRTAGDYAAAGFQHVTPPRGAARHIPSSVEEGSFPAIFRVRDRN
jgi:hypothetical protein